MGDVAPVAPQGSTPSPAPAPAPTNEAPINHNPTSVPNPVGSQAPDAPDTSSRRTPTRQEAIQRAFERANNPPKAERREAKPEPKAADAKPGHNKPPSETPPEKFDLRKRPTDQKGDIEDARPSRERGEHGHFAPRDNRANQNQASVTQQQQKPVAQLPENTPYRDPPPRLAEHAKRDWAATPESVRGEIHRMGQEFLKAYNLYKTDADRMKPIAPFYKMAQDHGTTLERALTNYVSMEQKLRADPIAGLDLIIHNLNLQRSDGGRATLRDIAYHVLSQSPEQLRQVQLGNTQQAAAHQIGALHQEIAGLKSTLQQMSDRQQFTYTRSQVDQFAETHPRFDELGKVIEAELRLGFDLETAYRRAELLYPTTHAAQTRETTPSAQTRSIDKSISGAPDVAPSNGASRRPREPSRSVNEAVARAMQRVGAGF